MAAQKIHCKSKMSINTGLILHVLQSCVLLNSFQVVLYID